MAAAFLEPEKYSSIFIPVYDEVLTCDQMVKTFTEVTGIKARCGPGHVLRGIRVQGFSASTYGPALARRVS